MSAPLRVLGLLSGTSADGVDAAAARIEVVVGTLQIHRLGEATLPWPEPLRQRVLAAGKERYHAGYLDAALARAPVAQLPDLLATLAELTAAAVAADAARYGVRQVWAAGGGVHNAGLMAALRRRLAATGAALATTVELGLPVDAKEAYAFAVLGWLTWHGLPGTLPSCTGAAGPRVLGAIIPGAAPLRLPEPVPDPPHRAVIE